MEDVLRTFGDFIDMMHSLIFILKDALQCCELLLILAGEGSEPRWKELGKKACSFICFPQEAETPELTMGSVLSLLATEMKI